jgi:hypothetical protein
MALQLARRNVLSSERHWRESPGHGPGLSPVHPEKCFEATMEERLLGLRNVTWFADVLDSGRFRLDT